MAPAAAQPAETPDPSATQTSAGSEVYCTPDDPGLVELSGLTVVGDTIYAVGDSGNDDRVAAMDSSCQVLEWIPNPIDPYDVEDMTYRNGRLWLADIGDNAGVRDTIAMTDLNLTDRTGAVHRMTYPDGPRDAEAILLEADGRPVVITKDAGGNSEIFTADVPVEDLAAPGPTPMRAVGPFVVTSTGTEGGPPLIDGSLMVTGAAIDASGTVAAVRTYTDLYLFRIGDGGVAQSLLGPPALVVPLPAQPQGEAIAFLDNGDLLVASEGGTRQATQPIAVVRGVVDMVAPADIAEPVADGSVSPSGALIFALSATVLLIGVSVLLGRRSRRRAAEEDDAYDISDDVDDEIAAEDRALPFDPDDPYALDPTDTDASNAKGGRGRR
ncbi:hypothetical protein [Millisia brevis]|uniref:hypothetical protein n=1 Tax=Millisia brevis TaxID=264148 RepID=UPI00082FBDEA|nr:hypothetical protein [Millisia brevis]